MNNNNNNHIIKQSSQFIKVGSEVREKLPSDQYDDNPKESSQSQFWNKFTCINPIKIFTTCNPLAFYQKIPSWSKTNSSTDTQKVLESTNDRRQKLINEAEKLKNHADAHFTIFKKTKKQTSKANALNYLRQYKKKMTQVSFLEKQFNQLKDVNDSIETNQHNIEVTKALRSGSKQLKNSMPNVDKVENIILDISGTMDDFYEVNQQFEQGFTSVNNPNINIDDQDLMKELEQEYDINENDSISLTINNYPEVPNNVPQYINNNNNNFQNNDRLLNYPNQNSNQLIEELN